MDVDRMCVPALCVVSVNMFNDIQYSAFDCSVFFFIFHLLLFCLLSFNLFWLYSTGWLFGYARTHLDIVYDILPTTLFDHIYVSLIYILGRILNTEHGTFGFYCLFSVDESINFHFIQCCLLFTEINAFFSPNSHSLFVRFFFCSFFSFSI